MSRVRTTQLAPERPTWSQYIEHGNLPKGSGDWVLDGTLRFKNGQVIFENVAPVVQGGWTIETIKAQQQEIELLKATVEQLQKQLATRQRRYHERHGEPVVPRVA